MSTALNFQQPADLRDAVGREVCTTHWLTIDQRRIDLFAQATGDFQWIHVDPARAAAASPYGRTIAHGFLTLSLLGQWYEDYLPQALPFCGMGLNYGLNKLRFTQPVPVDSRVRGRFVLTQVDDVSGGLQLHFKVTVEIEGSDKPALVAESLVRRLYRTEGAQ
ncbi:MAG TPA: MaoC family dehydratase [Burkholderiaceae bacterium]|nr:MaoC family dehydratase [Burkholderiaceae bacterium]